MADQFQEYASTIDGPHDNAAVVTPADGADLANASRALLVGVGGTVTVDMVGVGTNIALPLQAGYSPCRVTRVYATGTTATGIVAVW